MKFRAVMNDPQYMREFQNIMLTLSKLTKDCVLKISKDYIHFIANEGSGTKAPLVWVEIDAKVYFSEYTVEGNILLSMSASYMGRAFAMLRQNARYCKIKLKNVTFPSLHISSEVISQSSEQSRQISHNVPVEVIPKIDCSYYALPKIPKCKIVLIIPSNRFMRGLIDKMKNLSPTIIFYATSNGEMSFVAETELTTITTLYRNLEKRALNPAEEEKSNETIEASCTIDCKKAFLFFSALHVPTSNLSCGIDDERLIHLEVNIRQGVVIHSILPAVCL